MISFACLVSLSFRNYIRDRNYCLTNCLLLHKVSELHLVNVDLNSGYVFGCLGMKLVIYAIGII